MFEINHNNLPEAVSLLLEKLENLETLLQQQHAPQTIESDRITDLKEVENLTGYSKSKLYKLSSTDGIPHKLMGNRLVFSRSELLAWLETITVNRQPKSKSVLSSIAHSAANKSRR
jgi:predicted DNA-binding transcriptional regulator AlpA